MTEEQRETLDQDLANIVKNLDDISTLLDAVGGGEKGRQFGGREGARCEVTLWPAVGAGMERKRLLLL